MPNDFFERIIEINQNMPRTSLSSYLGDCPISKDSEQNNYAPNNYALNTCALDRQAQEFLSKYYQSPINSGHALDLHINIWNYEALIHSIWHAQQHSFAYKEQLSNITCQKLLEDFHEKFTDINFENSTLVNSVPMDMILKKSNPVDVAKSKQNIHEIRLLCKQLLEHIPCTTGQDIATHSDTFLAVKHDDVHGLISVETSGTTAQSQSQTILQKDTATHSPGLSSKRVYCSASDLQSTVDFFFYGMQYMLHKNKNKVALLMSGSRQGSVGHLLKEAMDALGVDCMIFGFSTEMEEVTKALLEYEPTCLIGIPWHILSLSHHAQNTKLKDTVACVLLSGDSLSAHMRRHMAENLNCDVFVHYGLTETGLGGAVECKQHTGLHMRQLDLYVEILDEHLQAVDDGVIGEIVITTLTRQAMPLIRYRTGDAGKLIHGKCNCGSVLQRLEVQGRMQQSILLQNKNSVHMTILQDFFYAHSGLRDFDICVFTDTLSAHTCLIIGVSFDISHDLSKLDFGKIDSIKSGSGKPDSGELNILQKSFSKTFDISVLNLSTDNLCGSNLPIHNLPTHNLYGIHKENLPQIALKENKNTGIMDFYICSMDAYKNFIAQNTPESIPKDIPELSPLKPLPKNPSSKKYIRYLQGSLSHLYKIL